MEGHWKDLRLSFFFVLIVSPRTVPVVEGAANGSMSMPTLDSGPTVEMVENAKIYENLCRQIQMLIRDGDSQTSIKEAAFTAASLMKMVQMQGMMMRPEAFDHNSLVTSLVPYVIGVAQNNSSQATSIFASLNKSGINISNSSVEDFHAIMQVLRRTCSYNLPYNNGVGALEYYDNLSYQIYHSGKQPALLEVVGDIQPGFSTHNTFEYGYTDDYIDVESTALAYMKGSGLQPIFYIVGLVSCLTWILSWIFKRRSSEFHGFPSRQVQAILYFSFSSLVFAHRENLGRNCPAFATNLVKFVVLILVMGYVASMTSMLTVENLRSSTEWDRMESIRFSSRPSVKPLGGHARNLVSVDTKKNHSISSEGLMGDELRKGLEVVMEDRATNKTMRIAVPVKRGFREFLNVNHSRRAVSGFCVNVFRDVMESLPYQFSFIPYENGREDDEGYYDELIYKLHLKEYDGVVGDITITANRAKLIDFTQPYMMSGISMVVQNVEVDGMKSLWWFLETMSPEMWVATIALFILKGILVWFFEHKTNVEFQGTIWKQVGKVLAFSFSMFAFAQKEKLDSNYSKFIVSIWTVVVLLLATCFAANVSSILTAKALQPTVTDLETLIENGEFVGYQKGSFVLEFLMLMGFEESKLKAYTTRDDYAGALLRGSANNGVSCIVDEIPYLKLFLAKYGDRYTMVGPTYRPSGFGFAFQRGSKIVSDISRAILELTEGSKMSLIEEKWFPFKKTTTGPYQTPGAPGKITFPTFSGVFLLSESSSGVAVLIFIFLFLYKSKATSNENVQSSQTSVSLENNPKALGNYSIEITENHANEEDSHDNTEIERDLTELPDGSLDVRTIENGNSLENVQKVESSIEES